MPISPDVVATALVDMLPKFTETFASWHPLLEQIVLKNNIDRATLQGPYREFDVVTGGPGQVSQVVYGSELIAGGRAQKAVRGNDYAPRLIYAYDVPGKDLAEANGEMDLAKIIQNYPMLALLHFHELLAAQMGSGGGTTPGVGGFVTFNGDQTYSPNGTARSGVFEYAAPASQTNVRFGLDPATVEGWYNQYATITSFSGHGRRRMRELYQRCNRQLAKALGPVDLIFADETSFHQYVDDLDSQVRVMDTSKGDKNPDTSRDSVPFGKATMYLEDAIDVADTALFTTAAARNGVMYFINSSTWNAYTLGHDANMESKGDFSVRGPFKVPDQDMWRYELILNMGLHPRSLRSNGVLTGAHNT